MKQPHKKKITHYTVSLMVAAAVISGCAPTQSLKRTAPVTLPSQFDQQSDTTSIGDLAWNKMFADPVLQQLIDTALQRNWDLQMALQRVEMAQANFLQTRGALKPSVEAVASAGVTRFGDYTLDGVGNYDTNLSPNIDKKQRIPSPLTPDYFVGLRSSWEIDLWGKLKSRKTAAYHRMLASQAGVNLVQTTLIAEIASRYYELLALDNEQKVLQQNRELQQAALEVVEAQKEGGRATELAVQQFKAQLLQTQTLETALRQRIRATQNELNLLSGGLPKDITRQQPALNDPLPEAVQAGLPSAILLRRPDIQQAELELKAADADVTAARAAFLPSLTLTPFVGFNAFSAATLFNPGSVALGALGSLAGPILNRHELKGSFYQAAAAKQQAYYAYQKAILTGYHEVVTHLGQWHNLQQQLALKQETVAALKAAVTSANDLYLSGYASYLEVITAQKGVLEAELDLINTRKAVFQSRINLYRALGGGWRN